ncbi:MAG: MFS transporter [Candidatus Methanogranum gryphiswaldense]|nr:MAG: MFS transporter [Candidatus Methanogranum sp. U3.2.1]
MSKSNKQFRPNKVTLVTIMFASMMILMGAAAVAPALEPISKAFPDASKLAVSLVVTLPALAVTITGFGIGYLADRFGKAKIFLVSLVIFTIAGVAGFFLDSLSSILMVRFILGIGIAGISLATTALIAEYYEGAQRVKIIALQSAAMGAGVLLLESVGGALADVGWNEPFLIYLIGIPILLLAIVSVREPVRVEINEKVLPEAIITNKGRKMALCYLMIFLAMFMMFILPTNLPYHIVDIGSNLFVCGLLLGILGVSQAAFSLLYSRSSRKLNDISAYSVAFATVGVGFCLLNFTDLALIIVSMALIGIGMGLVTLTVVGRLSYISQAGGSGKIMGGYSVAFNIGIFASSLAIIPVVEASNSYTQAFLYAGIFALIVCVVCSVASLIRMPVGKNPVMSSDRTVSDKEFKQEFDRILIATDGSQNSMNAVRIGLNIAKNNNSSVTALYVFDSDYYSTIVPDMPSAEDIKHLGETVSKDAFVFVKDEAENRGIKVDFKVLYGHPAEVIVEESAHYSLVVCGSLGRTNIARALMGSVAEKVARMAMCPVLICRKTN